MPDGSNLPSEFPPTTASEHQDRRQSPRYDMAGGVYLLAAGAEPTKIGTVRDISLNGAYVTSQEDMPYDTPLKLQFKIGADFEISGHICRRERSGFAIAFEQQQAESTQTAEA